MVEFRILGSLRVAVDGSDVDVGTGRQRELLGRLVIEANCVVPLDCLVDDLLPDHPTAGTGMLRTYVSRLRRMIGGDHLVTRSPGYVVVVEPGELDADRFESLVEQARDPALAPGAAVELFDEAEGLWQGPALVELADQAWARPVAERLNRLRLDATADRLDALLAGGRPDTVAGEAEALVERYPLDERVWGLLVVAHYQSGRQADALRAYQRARTILVDELGTEPGPALRALERAVLRHDPAIAPASASTGTPHPAAPVTRGAPRGVMSDVSWMPPAIGALVGRKSALKAVMRRVARVTEGRRPGARRQPRSGGPSPAARGGRSPRRTALPPAGRRPAARRPPSG